VNGVPAPPLLAVFLERWNHHDVEGVLALYAPDAVMRDPLLDPPLQGTAALRGYYERQWAATSDASLTLGGVAFDEHAIAWAWVYSGSTGGTAWTSVGTSFFLVAEGLIAEDHAVWRPDRQG
jgi:nuclear transport factor 2 (NTF2) superfamily protein